jgi:hypothetical protein
VEDNFSDVKPTIGYASAEQKLDEVYGIEEMEPVHANEVEAEANKVREEKLKTDDKKENKSAEKAANADETSKETDDLKQDKENDKGEGVDTDGREDEAVVSEEEKEITEEKEEAPKAEEKVAEDKKEEEAEPEVKVQVEKPEEDIAAMEESAAAVFEKEQDSTTEEEDKAIDAEVVTIAPDENAKVEDAGVKIDFAFEREPAPEEPKKVQKEITFEDFHDYKEPEFIRKDQPAKPKEEIKIEDKKEEETPTAVKDWRDWEPSSSSDKKEEPKEEPKAETKADPDTAVRDWRDWEPTKTPEAPKAEVPKAEEPKKEEPKKEEPKQEVKKSLNDMAGGKVISLGLNDRIAFEKNLFGGSGEDLNRVLSQLNTFNSLSEARNFIDDLVKPDYNNWKNKEEYEERFMAIVEKRFE